MNEFQSIPLEARLAERAAPESPVLMYQRWHELLFLHWAVNPEMVEASLPEGLTVDTFDGKAWIGIVPFSMSGVRPRFLPAVPGLSSFPELNLRTYVVDAEGRPGVWFYSLDTPKRLPNCIARTFFHLNYRMARIGEYFYEKGCRHRSELKVDSTWDASQSFDWQREGEAFAAEPGSLEFFLVERYRLFAHDSKRKRLLTGKVHHVPYPIQRVKLEDYSDRLFTLNGIDAPGKAPDSVLASAGVAVRIHPMKLI